MEQLGIAEAAHHLSEIATRVKETGQGVTLTHLGEPYVDMVPHTVVAPRQPKSAVFAALAELHRSLPKHDHTQAEIHAAIAEGRR